jgi:hypothetical protein
MGLRSLYTCTQGRSGAGSHDQEQHVCQHIMTSEPSSSWTAYTSGETMPEPSEKYLGKGFNNMLISRELV